MRCLASFGVQGQPARASLRSRVSRQARTILFAQVSRLEERSGGRPEPGLPRARL